MEENLLNMYGYFMDCLIMMIIIITILMIIIVIVIVIVLMILLLLVVVVVVPNGLLIDLWAKHTFSKHMYKTIEKHYTVEQPMLQKSHTNSNP